MPTCSVRPAAVCRARAEAAGLLLNNVNNKVGINVTTTAVVSAMRIRTAPPFVGRHSGARLCSV
jgi:hypothetical protein